MKAVVFGGDRTVEFVDFPDPTPGPGEVVLEMKASGMCGTDLKFYRLSRSDALKMVGLGTDAGAVIAGHEPCGVVAAVGPGVTSREAKVGDRVMVHHYAGCRVCPNCRTGWTQLCDNELIVYGYNGHGAHAPYMKVPAYSLVPLPDSLSFAAGAAISCGTGTAYGGLLRLDISARDTIAVVGQGPVGLSATALASAMGARVIALDIEDERLARAREFGASETINPATTDPVAAIKALTGGHGADLTMDSAGTPDSRLVAVRGTKKWGKACLIGEGGTLTVDVSPDILRKQLTIIGSWTFSTVGQGECARFCADHNVPVDALFTRDWRLSEATEAYQWFDRQSSGKGVFLF